MQQVEVNIEELLIVYLYLGNELVLINIRKYDR
jgi:hypothetical protein